MALASQLAALLENIERSAPPQAVRDINAARKKVSATFDRDAAIKEGDRLPRFSLPNATGGYTDSADLISNGPILITFYRGGWCPYCNLALHDLQVHNDDFKAKGVTLVAISPELPDQTLSTAEKHELEFVVLSDVGSWYARQLGISWKQPENLRPHFEEFGADLNVRNGDTSFEVSLPCTFLVDRDGVVRNAYIEPDYTKRLETTVALAWADKL